MCTVTWTYAGDGYTLLMNRDELHTRGPALPPQRFTADGTTYLAPIDTDGNGTWIAANELGVCVGVLNRYPPGFIDAGSGNYRSRGQLILELATAGSARSAISNLLGRPLESYRPFTAFALDPEHATALVWDGSGTPAVSEPRLPLSSSSFRGDEVVGEREELFARMTQESGRSVETLRQFHSAHDPDRSPYSVCMKRPDAATKSYSEVTVTSDLVTFIYHAGAPCDDAPQSVHTLPRLEEAGG